MKTIEFKPEGKSTIITPVLSPADEAARNAVLIEVLPLIFHKLKNKLTPILGYTQVLHSRCNDEYTRERLERIESNTSVLSDALNALKDYVKPGRGHRSPAALDRILEELAPEWQEMANAARARVILELEPGLPELALDPGRVRVLLLHLAANALNALRTKTGEEREIRISARMNGTLLRLCVHDNGRGMEAEELAQIWTPFYSNFPDHAGLGLVICEKIIADHGGACAVTSKTGEFTRVEIDFPLPGSMIAGAEKPKTATMRSQS